MREIWKPVVGYEGYYEISTRGRVRNTRGIRAWNWTQKGYAIIQLQSAGRGTRKTKLISRLVLEAFVGPAPSGSHQAAHGDGDKANNSLDNLRWATPLENDQDKDRHDTRLVRNGESLNRGVLGQGDVHRIRDLRAAGCTHKEISGWVGTCLSNVCYILQGRTWSHV